MAGSSPCVGTVDGNVTSFFGTDDGVPTTGYLCDVADGIACDSETNACELLAQVGETCNSSFYRCVPSAYCAFTTGTCEARLALGEGCTSNDECAVAAYCEPTSSTCASRRANGAVCASNSECESDDCTNQKCAAENDFGLALLCGSE